MTGGAAGAVGDGGVVVALVVEMTAQATATQEVVGKGEDILGGGGFGDLDHRLQISCGAKGSAHQVDEIFQGEMRCGAETVDLSGMAWTAGPGHRLRVSRLGDQVGVRPTFFRGAVVALMTDRAGHGVVVVQFDGVADGAATGIDRGGECRTAADQQEECSSDQGQRQGDPV